MITLILAKKSRLFQLSISFEALDLYDFWIKQNQEIFRLLWWMSIAMD